MFVKSRILKREGVDALKKKKTTLMHSCVSDVLCVLCSIFVLCLIVLLSCVDFVVCLFIGCLWHANLCCKVS